MSILSTLEREALFTLTRLLALVVTLLLVLGVAYAGYVAMTGTVKVPPVTVAAGEVSAAMAADPTSQAPNPDLLSDESDPLKGLKVPEHPLLKQWLATAQIRSIIERKARNVARADRQRWLNELAQAVVQAEKDQKVPGSYADTFFTMWENAQAKTRAAEAAKTAEHERAVYGALAGLALIALFSLVLVLLAIERNTRPAEAKV